MLVNSRSPALFGTVVVCFLVSGAAGLIYQTVWARYLGLFLGHTSYAVVAVLVSFMGGLALGNAWLGHFADRTRRPLALYGYLELGIGLYAVLFPHYYQFCHDGYVAVLRSTGAGGSGVLALKFAFSLLTILVPTVLMGATFPALARFATRALAELREKVAMLYAVNSAGAIAGCVLADFILIPGIGLEASLYVAAFCNVAPGAVALYLSYQLRENQLADEIAEPASPNAGGPSAEAPVSSHARLALAAIGISGFVAMLYEVVWTRLLALALGSSTHAFSLMLITFISGITVGAVIIYRWKNLKDDLNAFGWAEIALAGTLFLSMFFYEYLPFVFGKMAGLLDRTDANYPFYALLQLGLCFLVMFVPTTCLGMTLPLVSRISTSELRHAGGSVGRVFAVNTAGTVLGAALTGLWLMPQLGMARTLALGILLNAGIGLAVLLRSTQVSRIGVMAGVGLAGVVWVWTAGNVFQPTWKQAFSAGFWRLTNMPNDLAAYRSYLRSGEFAYYKDGAGSSVCVVPTYGSGKTNLFLKVNGKTDASTAEDMKTQVMSGHVPMMLKPSATNALIVGLGCGVTCGAVAVHPSIRHIDLVEISPEVVEGARLFGPYNHRVLENHPKVRVVIEDAKSFLLASESKYDVIVSEPSNPWMAGVAAVFSREFYEQCASRLSPGGVMVQWVQAYESNDRTFALMLHTFGSVFPHLSVWQGWQGDLLVTGSLLPLEPDLAGMEARFQHADVKADLKRIEVNSLPVFLSHQLISSGWGRFVAPPDAEMHTDLYPVLEFLAQRAFFVRTSSDLWQVFNENYNPRSSTLLGRYLRERSLTEDDYWSFVDYHLPNAIAPGRLLRSLFLRWREQDPNSIEPLALLTRVVSPPLPHEVFALRFEKDLARLESFAKKDLLPYRQLVMNMMQTYRDERTIFRVPDAQVLRETLEKLIRLDPANQRVYRLYLAEIAWDRSDDAACLQWAADAFNPDESKFGLIQFKLDPKAPPRVLQRAIESLLQLGRFDDAISMCRQALQQGYVGERVVNRDLWLEATIRKVDFRLQEARGPAPAATP
ncbi:MAG: hypothetical protein FJ404_10790 [Verrucomicrobia bacterium]|nr:hypothetical protein [Verrucomicrobiota bacterium]